MPITPSKALYYPYIDIRNERWLRSAILFWDSLMTIVPESFTHPYSSDFAMELSDEGILTPFHVSPEMDEIESLTETVIDFLTDPASKNVLLPDGGMRSREIHPEKLPRDIRKLVDIHPDKLPYKIRGIIDDHMKDDGWLEVSSGFANFYMTLLATKLANEKALGLVTESRSADQLAIAVGKGKTHSVLGSDHSNRNWRRRSIPTETAPGLMYDLAIQSIELPQHVSLKDLLKFRKYHKEELSIFRHEINRLVSKIPEGLSVEALKEVVHNQYNDQMLPAIKSLRKSLRDEGWEGTLNGILKASFFSAAPTAAAVYAGIPTSIALLAGAGVSLTASAISVTNQRNRIRRESPYSYLLSLENEMFY